MAAKKTPSTSAAEVMASRALPVVAIGASAGGLDATSKLFDGIPAACGMAFIVVQHLDPSHESLMAQLLAEHTAMPVVEATDGCQLLADHVYVIPPGRYLSVRNASLYLTAPQTTHGVRLPFDALLHSLAESYGVLTIAVVLSGTGSDGSGGLAALKAAGGFIIAQDPDEAEWGGMPQSAIATGLVDRILPLAEMPKALARRGLGMAGQPEAPILLGLPVADLGAIISLLKETTAHDFRQYKPGTIERRIERRMALLAIARGDYAGYLDRLRADPAEPELLARDLLINVTSFFRDPAVFDMLAAKVIPELIARLPAQRPLRIWVAGCSSGEEAYSIAMVCREAITAAQRDIKLQIFASDVDPDAIATAREGLYPLDIVATVPPARLERFFTKDESGYRIVPDLRGDVVFSVQDVLSDAPFSRIDLVSCRNLLFYLNAEAQAKVISLFHFSLREGGILLLAVWADVARRSR